jgi:hypothetical protein
MIGQSLGLPPRFVSPTGPAWRGQPPRVMQRYVAPSRVYMPPSAPMITRIAPSVQPAWRGDAMMHHRQALKEMDERRRLAQMTANIAAQQNTIQAQQAAFTAQQQLIAAQQAATATAAAAGAPPPAPVASLPPLNPIVTQSPMPEPQASSSPSAETDVSQQQDAANDVTAANAQMPPHGHGKLFLGLVVAAAGIGGFVWYKKHKKGGHAGGHARHHAAE